MQGGRHEDHLRDEISKHWYTPVSSRTLSANKALTRAQAPLPSEGTACKGAGAQHARCKLQSLS